MSTVKVAQSSLKGKVTVSGAKNSALKLLVASLLTNKEVIIGNFPSNLDDIKVSLGMLKALGKEVITEGSLLRILPEKTYIKNNLVWDDRSIRTTLLVLAALTTRFGNARVPLPGGCTIGNRGYDLHQMVLEKLGAKVVISNGYISAECKGKLNGTDIFLPLRSTGATENAILSACLAKGKTRIWNPHVRPEIIELISFLKGMGAHILVRGQESIIVEGVENLNGIRYNVMPDNIEALTYLVGSVITNGDVEIVGFPTKDLEVPLIFLRESGARLYEGDGSLIVRGGCCYPLELSTGPYPGINSDMQPILAVFALCAHGESKIIDLRFPDRFDYLEELSKLGANYKIVNNIAVIKGSKLVGGKAKALDLRGGAALLLAGLVAEGETIIDSFEQVHRGYEDVIEKIRSLGGIIEEV